MPKILVVDDARPIRTAVRQMLEQLNFAVDEAENGDVAWGYCQTGQQPDGMIVDINMPGLDGISLVKQIRSDHSFDRMKLIMCTTETSLGQVQEALASGANEYIMKPFSREVIADKLRILGLIP